MYISAYFEHFEGRSLMPDNSTGYWKMELDIQAYAKCQLVLIYMAFQTLLIKSFICAKCTESSRFVSITKQNNFRKGNALR